MKYIGVDKDGKIYATKYRPCWNYEWWKYHVHPYNVIPQGVLPPLEPCCLYKITKDAYVLIEDRRKK